jgi:hypothetical protein
MAYSWKRRMNEVDGWNLQDHLTSIHLLLGYVAIDDSSYRLNFDPDKKDEIYHYSFKEHP